MDFFQVICFIDSEKGVSKQKTKGGYREKKYITPEV